MREEDEREKERTKQSFCFEFPFTKRHFIRNMCFDSFRVCFKTNTKVGGVTNVQKKKEEAENEERMHRGGCMYLCIVRMHECEWEMKFRFGCTRSGLRFRDSISSRLFR